MPAGDQADKAGGDCAVSKIQSVPAAADVVIGAGVQQQTGVRLVQPFLHGAHGAVTDGALNVTDAVDVAFIEHAQIQVLHGAEKKRIEDPALQPVHQGLKLLPVRFPEQIQQNAVPRHDSLASLFFLKYNLS